MAGVEGGPRFDHVVSVMFENRSFDNLLGRLYEPGEVASFEGVIGKDLSNPIPSYAPGAERGVVPLHVARPLTRGIRTRGDPHRRAVLDELDGQLQPEHPLSMFVVSDVVLPRPVRGVGLFCWFWAWPCALPGGRRLPDHAFIWKPAGDGGDMPSRVSSRCQAADRDGPLCCWRPWRGGSSAPLRSAS